jgi:hypothetical protein
LIANKFVGCSAYASCWMNDPQMNAEVAKGHQNGISLANMIKLLVPLQIEIPKRRGVARLHLACGPSSVTSSRDVSAIHKGGIVPCSQISRGFPSFHTNQRTTPCSGERTRSRQVAQCSILRFYDERHPRNDAGKKSHTTLLTAFFSPCFPC